MKNWLKTLGNLFKGKVQPLRNEERGIDYGNAALNSEIQSQFDALCQFTWIQGGPMPLIFDLNEKIYNDQGITHDVLIQLETNGLIQYNPSGFVRKKFGKHTRLFYCGEPTKIGFPKDYDNQLDLGYVILTERGKALMSSDKMKRNQAFYHYVINRWYQLGFMVASIQVDQRNNKMDKKSIESILPDNH